MVEAPSAFHLERLRQGFRGDLEAARIAAGPEVKSVEYRVAPALGESAQASHAANQPSKSPPDIVAMPARAAATLPEKESSLGTAGSASTERKLARLDRYVVGEGNKLAATSAQMVVDRPGVMSPLFLHGPTGVGKSHLLEAILHATRRHAPQRRALFLSAEQFTTFFLQALHGKGLPTFRQKYRGVELLIVDDVQFFANKQATLVELLHTIDNLQRAGKQLVLAADRPPEELTSLGKELIARLSGGLSCAIATPEYETRLGILRTAMTEQKLELPTALLEQLAEQLPGDARRLRGAIHRLAALAMTGEKVTYVSAQPVLADLLRSGTRLVRLPDIEKAVCDAFGVAPDELHSAKKSKQVSQPRMFAMWLARKLTRAGLTEIGSFFGRKSHSTVVAAQKRVDQWRTRGGNVQLVDCSCDVDEALRRLEVRLRTG